jgi:hypothetical protein
MWGDGGGGGGMRVCHLATFFRVYVGVGVSMWVGGWVGGWVGVILQLSFPKW